MTNLTVLTHSSSDKRIFYQVNTVKTAETNSLKVTTARDRILAKQHITKHGHLCISWEPKQELKRDLRDGGVYRRYATQLQDSNNANKVDIYEGDENEH